MTGRVAGATHHGPSPQHPYLPNTERDRQAMLEAIGVASIEELFADIPARLRLQRPLALPPGLSEMEVAARLKELAARNQNGRDLVCFLGAGVYDHYVPATVDEVISRGEFYTSYTPYQPEVSQGNLQVIFEFQSMICELTGMDVANASMYDGPSAAAEASLMAVNITRRETILVPATLHPEYRQVIETYAGHQDLTVRTLPMRDGVTDPESLAEALQAEPACLVLQVPNFFGIVEEAAAVAEQVRAAGALLIVVADPISLGLLEAPGRYGADIVCGEGQALGNPMSYGGPHFGFLAAREAFIRRMPGRIAGAAVDVDGNRGYVLTLQTREQHIRRERATSNICTNQALNALAGTVYMATLGRQGLRDVADLCLQKSHYLARRIAAIPGFELAFPDRPFFKEFAVRCRRPVADVLQSLLDEGILGGVPLGRFDAALDDCLLVAVTEQRTRAQLDRYVACLEAMA